MLAYFEREIAPLARKLEKNLGITKIVVRDDSHEYVVDVSKHDYDPSKIEFTFIDKTEDAGVPF